MKSPGHCAAVIPCLNEAETVGRIVSGTLRFLPAVYVVDDGSKDETARIASRAGAFVIRHESPKGKGAALRRGFDLALEEGFEFAITLDGDGQHDPAHIPEFLAAAGRGADLVIGNRLATPQGMPWVRLCVNRWMSRRLSALAGRDLPDSQCGYRLLRLARCAALDCRCEHFDFESELLLRFALAGHRLEFVPVAVIYQAERSKIDPVRDTIRWLAWWSRMRLQAKNSQPQLPSLPACPGHAPSS